MKDKNSYHDLTILSYLQSTKITFTHIKNFKPPPLVWGKPKMNMQLQVSQSFEEYQIYNKLTINSWKSNFILH